MVIIAILEQKRLSNSKVRQLVLESVELIQDTRDELGLPLFQTIEETGQRLRQGVLQANSFRLRRSGPFYAKVYGYFKAPSTIVLDESLPLEGRLFDQPELATSATYYCAVHEVIHADDYTNGDHLVKGTLRHISQMHKDELEKAAQLLKRYSRGRWGRSKKAIVNTWTYQYVDSATHFRAYIVLRHKKLPKIDNIWVSLYNSIFSPRLFTTLEAVKGLQYTSKLLSEQVGKTCIVEIAKEYEEIAEQNVRRYTV